MDMEDLDALLADLQATPTAKPTVYSKSVNSDCAEGASNQKVSPSGSPPPIPPAPSAYTPLPDYSKLKSRPPATMPKPSKAGAADVAPSFSEGLADHVNNNMSELDGLLSELDNSVDGRVLPAHSPGGAFTNGDARGGSSTSHSSLSDHSNVMGKPASPYTSTVDDLIDELGSVVQHPLQLRPTTGRALLSDPPSMRTASSATRELDELMASLSDFKVNVQKATDTVDGKPVPDHAPAKVPAPDEERARLDKTERQAPVKQPHAKQQPARAHITPVQPLESFGAPPSANLDSMLGSLQSNMSKQGVTTVTKGTCAACNKPIIGQVCTALGRTWHPEHFCCDVCDVALGTKTFFERDGRPYCEKDYHEKFAPRCFGCDGPILDACVTSLDHTWHPEHFVCSECGKPFGDAGFHEKDGKAFCRDDYFKMFAPKCSGCNSAIIDNYISALSGHWHPQCFVCMECRQPFQGGSFFEHEGMPYCEMHYHARRGSLCYSCQKPITGRCITAMHRKFHPEHFICAFCLKQLNKGTFKEQNDKPYCHPCFVKLFG